MAVKLTKKKNVAPKKPATKKVIKKIAPKPATKKKVTPKKTTGKKSENKSRDIQTIPTRYMVIARGDQRFFTQDGQIIEDILGLHNALSLMADEIFAYHATGPMNDFAEWVEHVLEDSLLAESLRNEASRKKSANVVKQHLNLYII